MRTMQSQPEIDSTVNRTPITNASGDLAAAATTPTTSSDTLPEEPTAQPVNPFLMPEHAPSFLYGTLAPHWATRNAIVPIDDRLIRDVLNDISGQSGYIRDAAAFDDLVKIGDATPKRRRLLGQLIMSAILGLPDDPHNLFTEHLARRHPGAENMRIYPTRELVEHMYATVYGWGPLEPYMSDPTVTEIMVNDWDKIFVERTVVDDGGISRAVVVREPNRFESATRYNDFVITLVQRIGREQQLSMSDPTLDLRLPDGSRLNVTYPPVVDAPKLTIRKFSSHVLTLDWLEARGAMSPEMRRFFEEATLAEANIIVYGQTGSGKTTLLGALIDAKPSTKRILTIEDTPEIVIDPARHDDYVQMQRTESRNMGALVRNTLRQRGDAVVVGETRDGTAFDLIQAFNSGTRGSLSTVHADDALSAIDKLCNLVQMSDDARNIQDRAVRRMVRDAIHVLVHTVRLSDGSRRITSIDEVEAEGDAEIINIFTGVARPDTTTHKSVVSFVRNPDYRMSQRLREMWYEVGLDPDVWTGERAVVATP